MTSRPAARARTTLVEARQPVDPIGRTVAVRAGENGVMARVAPPAVVPDRAQQRAQAVHREEPRVGAREGPHPRGREERQAGADRNATTEAPLLVRAEVSGAVIAGLMVQVVVMTAARTVVPVAPRIAVMTGVLIVVLVAGRTVRASVVVRC